MKINRFLNFATEPKQLITRRGRTPLYLATEITMFEIENPWLATPENRVNYSNWIFKNIIANDSDN